MNVISQTFSLFLNYLITLFRLYLVMVMMNTRNGDQLRLLYFVFGLYQTMCQLLKQK